MPLPWDTRVVALEDRDRHVILTVAATVMCPLSILRAIHFSNVAPRTQQRRVRVLSRLQLVEQVSVNARGPARTRSRVLISLSSRGWQFAEALGVTVPPPSMRQLASVIPGAVALVADAYATAATSGLLDTRAEWTVCPRPSQEYAPMPGGVWASFQGGQVLLTFDLDFPGRSLAQVENRLKNWHHFVVAHQNERRISVCYVVADDRRRREIEPLRSQKGWEWLQLDTPSTVLQTRFISDTPRG